MRYIGTTVIALGLLALPLSASAQQQERAPAKEPAVKQERQERTTTPEARRHQPQKLTVQSIPADQLRNARVVDKQGEELGQVRELRIDPKEGRITQAEIGVGGVLGIGQERFNVDWKQVEVMQRDREIVLALSDEAAMRARQDVDRARGEKRAPAERQPGKAPAGETTRR